MLLIQTKHILPLLLSVCSLVAAHGKVTLMKGDAGGSAAALGILNGVPGQGANDKTEVDTTVFGMNSDCGVTNDNAPANQRIQIDPTKAQQVKDSMTVVNSTQLPQVKSQISGIWHTVTSDGGGIDDQLFGYIDQSGKGNFLTSNPDLIKATFSGKVPGNDVGNVNSDGSVPPGQQAGKTVDKRRRFASILGRGLITKRAVNVDTDSAIKFDIPPGTICKEANICVMKITNRSPAGPFGGCVLFQMANAVTTRSSEPGDETVTSRSIQGESGPVAGAAVYGSYQDYGTYGQV